MLICKGVQRKTGEFQGNKYDNVMLHCLNTTPSSPCIAGDACETIKIKSAEVYQVFGGLIKTDADWRELIDQAIQPFYDRYGRAVQVQLVDKPK